jgi:hypothetical protein
VWVQLITAKTIYLDGETKQYHSGDWVNVGKALGLRMLELREARTTDITKLDIFNASGDNQGVYFAGNATRGKEILHKSLGPANWATAPPIFRWSKVMYWDASTVPSLEVIPVAWDLLDKWEVVAPLYSYDKLATELGTKEDRELTKGVILDLRVPVYDCRVLFLRKCPATEELMERWAAEPGDRQLAFMRALWQVKPLIMSTPRTWADARAHDHEKWPRK